MRGDFSTNSDGGTNMNDVVTRYFNNNNKRKD